MKKQLAYCFNLIIVLLIHCSASAQSISCPEVNNTADNLSFHCTTAQPCTTLTAQMPDIRNTNTYTVTPTDYNAHFPFQITGATQVLVNQDDIYSGIINLPFTFCFYGSNYNQVVIGANGILSFYTNYANGQCQFRLCSTNGSTYYTLPSTTLDRNAILACFHDVDPSVSATNKGIEYILMGEAPCRKLVVNYRNLPQYRSPGAGGTNCNTLLSTFQVVLYENTNVIEVYVKDKPSCSSWNCGLATIGLQNLDRTQAIAAPGRNATVWGSANINEAWRFIPNGTSNLQNVQLLRDNAVVATGTTTVSSPGVLTATFTNVCAVNTPLTTYVVKANYNPCSGSALSASDTVRMYRSVKPAPPTVSTPVTYCLNATASPLTATGQNLKWYPSLSSTTYSTTAPVPNTASLGSTTYYVSQTVDTCESDRAGIVVNVVDNPVINIVPANPDICLGESVTLTANSVTGTSFSWSPGTGLSNTNTASVNASPNTTTTYTVTGTIGNCSASNTVTVTVHPLPVVNVSPASISICAGQSVGLTAGGATNYTWTPNTGLSAATGANVTASPSVTTTYTVTGTDANNCAAQATSTVNILPNVQHTVNASVCQGGTYNFGGNNLSTAGSYTHTFTAANSCDSTVTLNLTVINTIYRSFNDTICAGTQYTWANSTYSTTGSYIRVFNSSRNCDSVVTLNLFVLNPIQTNLSAAICSGSTYTFGSRQLSAAGIYHDTLRSVRGCDSVLILNLTVHPLPAISVSPANPSICIGQQVTLTASGATAYTWSPGASLNTTSGANVDASPVTTTTYTVTGTDANSCSNTANVTVTVNPLPPITVTPSSAAVCIGESVTLTASGATSYSWSPASGLNTTSGAVVVASPASTTTYSVVSTDANSCSNATTVTVVVNNSPVLSVSPENPAICIGSGVSMTASGALTYNWSPATGLSAVNTTTVNASPITTTTYKIVGTNAAGCKDSITTTVTVNPLPTVVVNPGTATVCAGDTAHLSAGGAVSYTWTPNTAINNPGSANVSVYPANTTTYTVTGTDVNNCSNTANAVITVNPLPVLTVSPVPAAVCTGQTINLTASGATTYSWAADPTLNTTTGATVTAAPGVTTNYTVTGTDANNCSSVLTTTVTVHPLPTINISPATAQICLGAAINLTASGAASYSWTPAGSLNSSTTATVTASPVTSTTYTVTGTDANGCVNTASREVTVTPVPSIQITPGGASICRGNSVTLSASGAGTYVWSPANGLNSNTAAVVTASPASTTTYTVRGTTEGCSDSATVTVSIYAQSPVQINGANAICSGQTTTLTASGAISYIWSPANSLSTSTGASVDAFPTSTTQYKVVGTDANSCKDSTTHTVTVHALPAVSINGASGVCAGSSVTLTASGAGNGGSYTWFPGTYLNTNTGTTVVATPIDSIRYKVVAQTNAGCQDSAFKTIRVLALPDVSIDSVAGICEGQAVQLNAHGAQTYEWQPASTLDNPSGASPIARPLNTTTYTVRGTGTNGCAAYDSVTVTVASLPTIVISGDTSVCLGASTRLQASGANSYIWSPGIFTDDSTSANPVINVNSTTTFTVRGSSASGCASTRNVTVTIIPHPDSRAYASDTSICEGETVNLYAEGGIAYSWSPAGTLSNAASSAPVASPREHTTYTVAIKLNACFTDTHSVSVNVHPVPKVSFPAAEVAIAEGGSIELQPIVENGNIYSWNPSTGLSCSDCLNPVASPGVNTRYVLTVSNEWGCSSAAEISFNITCDTSILFLPNTFTPNGDGVNDIFYVRSNSLKVVKRMIIYNRWGEVMYEANNVPANDAAYGWNGTYKGKDLNPDTYIYLFEAHCQNGKPLILKGDINLVK